MTPPPSPPLGQQVGKIKQYHAVVRMIHNPKTLDEDDIIQTFLVDAHLIFDGMPDNNTTNALRCDTLNSMGTHKQNRKLFADATDYFHKAMDIRTQKLASDAAGLAQARVHTHKHTHTHTKRERERLRERERD